MSERFLTEDQLSAREMAAVLARDEIAKYAAEADVAAAFPETSMGIITESGLATCALPEAYAGAGMGVLAQMLVIEEISKVCGSTGAILSAAFVGMDMVLKFGNEEQKASVLPGVAEGQLIVTAAEERAAYTDARKATATAVKTEGGWVLNGVKKHVAVPEQANWFVVFCNVEDQGLTAFLVPAGTDGLSVGRIEPKMGLRACPTGEVQLTDCKVDDTAVLGGVGKGAAIIDAMEEQMRLAMSAVAVGVAQGALKEAIDYANVRVQFGQPIARFQNTRHVLAEHYTRVMAARGMLWATAGDMDAGRPVKLQAALTKLSCGDAANLALRKCMQVMSGCGYSREYPMERMMRDAKMTEIFGGISEAQKDLIAQEIGLC